MQYVVSIENNNYHYWQIELLIESFIIQGLQDNLFITIAENSEPKFGGFSKNLISHEKKIIHENYGQEKKYKPANRIYSLRNLVYSGLLEPPFTILHPDMVLINPIENCIDSSFDLLINNYDYPEDDFIKNCLEKNNLDIDLSNIDEKIKKEFKFNMPIVFNESINKDVLSKFFDKLCINLEKLLEEYKDPSLPLERTCWTNTVLELSKFCSLQGCPMTSELFDKNDCTTSFIHYNRGIPPVFYKKSFFYDFRFRNSFDPYETLLENNFTKNTNLLCKIIKSYKK
jgi:hypothetical protein